MQFVTNGPDIPEQLLQAHEEGRVVFFCGAGISRPAGLPGFKGLVDDIYHRNDTKCEAVEKDAYDRNQFDVTLDLLEQRLPGQRLAMRNVLPKALKPKLHRKGAIDTHAALLQLARNREDALRLVTTNFDCIFKRAAKRTKQPFAAYAAPMLPIPKNNRWNGLVYLHGFLPDKPDDSALHRLVLTSGDFGLAYLSEGWAARFVSELFRNYIVCFVGYSINDSVLRYMMDALAADRRQGELTPRAYALGDCAPGQEDKKIEEWKAKGVTPILYEVPAGRHDHSALHNTLKKWAEIYQNGILGKEHIVVDYALAHPSASTKQDDFVGRLLWAISDESGMPAKRFAELNPAPPIEWLEEFSKKHLKHEELSRYGVLPRPDADTKLSFSLIHRPAPYTYALWMSLVSIGTDSQWDEVMRWLARWLLRHLNDPALILWIVQQGGQIHDRWALLIEEELNRLSGLEQEGNVPALEEIRENSPNAIPSPQTQTLWRLLLAGHVKLRGYDQNISQWVDDLKRNGLTTMLRLKLREMLTPKIILKKPSHRKTDDDNNGTPEGIEQLVDYELVLTAENVHSYLCELTGENWHKALPTLLNEFQQLLLDALDSFRELGGANDNSDRSFWDLPSISEHWQNRYFRDWVSLIVLLRDAWLAIRQSNPERATQIAQSWFDLPYPTFKRLALFAASRQDGPIKPTHWLNWLVADKAWWLWSPEMRRETMRLLVLQGKKLPPEAKAKLELAVLAGPPHKMYRANIEPERWRSIVDHSAWLILAKLKEGGSDLGDAALQRFAELSAANPSWKLRSHERDEFSHWMSGTGDPDYEDSREVDIAPDNWRDLINWLKQPIPDDRMFYKDTWRERCRTDFRLSIAALRDLEKENIWPAKRWDTAFYAWSEGEKCPIISWRIVAPLIQTMPDDILQELAHSITFWLQAVAKSLDRHEGIFRDLCRRVLALTDQDNPDVDDPINHPVGHVTQALLNLWFRQEPNDNDALPEPIERFFTQLCTVGNKRFRHGRVLLASQLIALFRVDRPWTEAHLLPFFSWDNDRLEAKAVWEGFLCSPRLYGPLMVTFKSQFLETAHHYEELGTQHRRQFAQFITYAALDPADGYTTQDFAKAIEALPQEGFLEYSAEALSQALESVGDSRENYWKNRILPFWKDVWPKSRKRATGNIARSLALLSIAAGGEFSSALKTVKDWLRPSPHPHYIIHKLNESGLLAQFPEDALCLLDAVMGEQSYPDQELRQCLDKISEASPELIQDARYKKLDIYLRGNNR